MLAAALHGLCAWSHSLLPAFLVMVVVFWAAAGGGPLGAAVLLGLLQELVQTEGILLKLNWTFPLLPVIGTWEFFVWNKPDGGQEKKKKKKVIMAGSKLKFLLEIIKLWSLTILVFSCRFVLPFRHPQSRKEDKLLKWRANCWNVASCSIYFLWEEITGLDPRYQSTSWNLCFYVSKNLLRSNMFFFYVLHSGVTPCSQPNIPRGQWQAGD